MCICVRMCTCMWAQLHQPRCHSTLHMLCVYVCVFWIHILKRTPNILIYTHAHTYACKTQTCTHTHTYIHTHIRSKPGGTKRKGAPCTGSLNNSFIYGISPYIVRYEGPNELGTHWHAHACTDDLKRKSELVIFAAILRRHETSDLRRHCQWKLSRMQRSRYDSMESLQSSHCNHLITIVSLQNWCVWHDSSVYVAWPMHTCDVTHPRVWHDLSCVSIQSEWIQSVNSFEVSKRNLSCFRKRDVEIFWFCWYKESRISWYTSFHSTIFKYSGCTNFLLV